MKPNPNEFIIMPKVPTDEMLASMYASKNMWANAHCDNRKELIRSESVPKYYAAISAAPPHNLVAVDKGELRELLKAVSFIRSTSGANQDNWFNEFDIRANKIRELLK